MNRPPAIREDHPNPAWARPTRRSLDGTWENSRRDAEALIRDSLRRTRIERPKKGFKNIVKGYFSTFTNKPFLLILIP